jgi:uncharacterized membrane protein
MTLLIAGLIVFLGVHSLAILPGVKAGAVARLGEGPYKGLYALASFAGLVLIVWGFEAARAAGATVVWEPPKAMKHINLLLMIPIFPLIIAAYVPGRIRALVRHPMLAAVKLWAFGHLLANGTLPDIVLFGAFLIWAVVDRISLKRRGIAPAPVARFVAGDWVAIGLGLVLYGLMLWRGHLFLIGVSPL